MNYFYWTVLRVDGDGPDLPYFHEDPQVMYAVKTAIATKCVHSRK
jgi:hypothetical protein